MSDLETMREMLTRAGISFTEDKLIEYHNLPEKRVIGRHYDDPPPPTHYGYQILIETGIEYESGCGDGNPIHTGIAFDLQGNLTEFL
jgi:hypothetical protein